MMYVVYRDGHEYVQVEVNDDGVKFKNGIAYFTDEDWTDYEIPAENLDEIVEWL